MTLKLSLLFDGAFTFRDGDDREYLQLDLGKGKLLMRYIDGVPAPLGENVPTFWSTAPTRIHTGLGIAINAKFDLDTGRSFPHGADVSKTNRDLIVGLSSGLYAVLSNVLRWKRFAGKSLRDDEDCYAFFNGLWMVFANLRCVGKWNGGENGVSFMRDIVWGGEELLSGYGRFISENGVIPSGLPGSWRRLYKLNEIRYVVPAGMMDSGLCLEAMRLLQEQDGVAADQTFGAINTCLLHVKTIMLDWRNVMEAILSAYAEMTPDVANGPIGAAIADAARRGDLPRESELKDLLRRFLFVSRSGELLYAKSLLCSAGYVRQDDEIVERLKIAFAPDDCVLSNDYDAIGQRVYRFCRSVDREGVEQDRLAEIAHQSVVQDRSGKLSAVLSYVCSSGCGDKFCEKFRALCGETWCADLLVDPLFLAFSDNEKMTIAGRLHLPIQWSRVVGSQPEQEELDLEAKDPKDELRDAVEGAVKYSYGWMKNCLDLEILVNGVDPEDARRNEDDEVRNDVTILFGHVEKLPGFRNTFVLSRANRAVPGWFREEQNQPIELNLSDGTRILTVIQEMAVEQDRLVARVKITNEMHGNFPDDDYSSVVSAKTSATKPGFLLAALQTMYAGLGLEDGAMLKDDLNADVKLIYGPPGTGKTEALVRDEIVHRILERTARTILVLTPTNKAADVVAERIKSVCEQKGVGCPWLCRFGLSASAELQAADIARGKDVAFGEDHTLVVVTTVMRLPYDMMRFPTGNVKALCQFDWDCVMFDEASMIPLMYMAYPLHRFKGKHIVIAGDPNQIEPVVRSAPLQGENIYTLIQLPSFGVLAAIDGSADIAGAYLEDCSVTVRCLMEQHRSVVSIGEVFSRFCYDGKLTHQRSGETGKVLNVTGLPDVYPLTVLRFPVERTEGIYKVGTVNRSSYHVYSAIFIFEYLRKFAKGFELSGYDEANPYKIGVVSPYRIQADVINRLLARESFPKSMEIQAQTIHGFQGDECELIVAMLNPPRGMGMDWTVEGERRRSAVNNRHILNVAISRARDHLIVALPSQLARNYERLVGPRDVVGKMVAVGNQYPGVYIEARMRDWEDLIWGPGEYIRRSTYLTGHQSVNVYTQPENRFEVRSEQSAVDIQFKDDCVPVPIESRETNDQVRNSGLSEGEIGAEPIEEARAKFHVPPGYHKPRPDECYVRSGKAYYQFNEDAGAVEKFVCEEECGDFPMDLIFAIEGVINGSSET